jgi:hypothetical protein
VAGPSQAGLALSLLAHRPTLPGDADAAFSLGVRLILLVPLATIAMGALLARRSDGRPRLEAAAAAVITLLGPSLLVGRLEGETAGLVFTALGGAGAALLGVGLPDALRRAKARFSGESRSSAIAVKATESPKRRKAKK